MIIVAGALGWQQPSMTNLNILRRFICKLLLMNYFIIFFKLNDLPHEIFKPFETGIKTPKNST